MNLEDKRPCVAYEEDDWNEPETKLSFMTWLKMVLILSISFFLTSCISARYHQRQMDEARREKTKEIKQVKVENQNLRIENKKLRRELQELE